MATTIKRFLVLAAITAALFSAASPAFAADTTSASKEVSGKFVLRLADLRVPNDGPARQGQTYYITQNGLDTDRTVPFCKSGSPSAIVMGCRSSRNMMPFAGKDGKTLDYRIWVRDGKTGETSTVKSGSITMHEGMKISARYGY